MLRSIKSLMGYTLKAKDGDIGKVVDFYFDDEQWAVRYLIARVGSLVWKKNVLISPAAFSGAPLWGKKEFPVILTRDRVKRSPDINTRRPLSPQQESKLTAYYQWPQYWSTWPGTSAPPVASGKGPAMEVIETKARAEEESRLRSAREVRRYVILGNDGKIGRVSDIVVDDSTWDIRYLMVDMRTLFKRKKVWIEPHRVTDVNWLRRTLTVNLPRKLVRECSV